MTCDDLKEMALSLEGIRIGLCNCVADIHQDEIEEKKKNY